jgi:hypothetical protein
MHYTESVIFYLTLTSGIFVMQMAGQLFWEVRLDGSVRTDRLHLEGLPAFCGTSFAHQGTLRLHLPGDGDHAAGRAPLPHLCDRAAPAGPPGVG